MKITTIMGAYLLCLASVARAEVRVPSLAPQVALEDSEEGTQLQTVYINQVPKEVAFPNRARFATRWHQVLVTGTPVPLAVVSIPVPLRRGESLIMVEDFNHEVRLSQEVTRVEGLVFLRVGEKEKKQIEDYLHQHFPLFYFTSIGAKDVAQPVFKRELAAWSARQATLVDGVIDADIHFLREKLSQFSGEVPVRIDGAPVTIRHRGSAANKQLARRFLAQEFQRLGFTVREESYRSGVNFVAERLGTDPSRTLIVSAHLDSMSNAGADDDGSGVISALAVARAVQRLNLKHTLRVVAFDEEERGLVGSRAYVQSHQSELSRIIGVINLEMTGFDSNDDGAMHVIDCNEQQSPELTAAIMSVISEGRFDLQMVPACTNRSDHASFWRYGVSAVVVSQNFFGRPSDVNPCYHRSCDRVENINFNYMARITNAIAHTVGYILTR